MHTSLATSHWSINSHLLLSVLEIDFFCRCRFLNFSAFSLFPWFSTSLSPLFKFIFFFLHDSIYFHVLEKKYWVTLSVWFCFSIIASCQEVFKRSTVVLLRNGKNLMYVTMLVTLIFTFFRVRKCICANPHYTFQAKNIFLFHINTFEYQPSA